MKGRTGDKARLQHILDAINEIENYIRGVTNHEYYVIDETIVWNIITEDLPNLKTQIISLTNRFVE